MDESSFVMRNEEVGYSTTRVAEMVGLSYRQVDYYARIGLVEPSLAPAKGNGSRRTWSETDVARLVLVGALRELGMVLPIIGKVLDYVPADVEEWPSFLFIGPDGQISDMRPRCATWWAVSLRRLIAESRTSSAAA